MLVLGNPFDRLPLDRTVRLNVYGGRLLSVSWFYAFEHQHLWWENADKPHVNGNEFSLEGFVLDNETLDTHVGHDELHYIVKSALVAHEATLFAQDRSIYFSDCADPYALPFVEECSTTPYDRFLGLDLFFVQPEGPSFRWALTGVPEPASWLLMLSGFGLAGALLRRRTAVRAVSSEGRPTVRA